MGGVSTQVLVPRVSTQVFGPRPAQAPLGACGENGLCDPERQGAGGFPEQ